MSKFVFSPDITEEQIVAFFGLVFAAARSDDFLSDAEIKKIFSIMDLNELTKATRDKIRGFIVEAPDTQQCIAVLKDSPADLRYALAIDIMMVAQADNVIIKEERNFFRDVCHQLGITSEQQAAIEDIFKKHNVGSDSMEDEVSVLQAVGIPKTALALSGAAFAFGLGFGALPILVGAAAYVASVFGSKNKQKEAEEQRKAQLVIKNLVETIGSLRERVNVTEQCTQEQREMLDELIKRLSSLYSTLPTA